MLFSYDAVYGFACREGGAPLILYFLLAHALLTGVMGVEDKDQKPQNYEPNMDSVGFNAESVVAGMVAPLQALRELLLWPVMYSKEAASLGLRVF